MNKFKVWFYWTFDRKNWTHIYSYKTGKFVGLCFHVHCFPTGSYPEAIQVWKHPKGYEKKIETFIFKLSILERPLGIKGVTWTGPR